MGSGELEAGVQSIIAGAEEGTASASSRLTDQLAAARRSVRLRAPKSEAARTLDQHLVALQLV
ncbi:hypothetical protein [Nocardia sp. NPDC019395]|uniref:hypothetical protein n=1 Tax=Nocardia sp. NPDC019395 TaxID=3154686 RepID=UPI0033DF0696